MRVSEDAPLRVATALIDSGDLPAALLRELGNGPAALADDDGRDEAASGTGAGSEACALGGSPALQLFQVQLTLGS